jgi:diadenosine tetraphosphate (Ap4A) HIT family hydrolase
MDAGCSICNGKADEEFKRVEVWSDETWRLTMSTYKAVKGFCYLEPRRHVPYITDLQGREAVEFGSVISRVARAIKSSTGAKLVYVYIYGDHVAHLHVHLAPHVDGDIFADDVIKADTKLEETLLDRDEESILAKSIGEEMSGHSAIV